MKTLQNLNDESNIIRATDTKAQQYISNGNWKYVSKSLWKDKIRNPSLEAKKNKSKRIKKCKFEKLLDDNYRVRDILTLYRYRF